MTLKEYLDDNGRGSLKRLAISVGTSKGYLSDIANGRRRPSPDIALQIQVSTGGQVPATTLLGLDAASTSHAA